MPAPALRADCSSCIGLCCVGPGFSASADFAIDKPVGQPCRHLRDDDRCGIHDRLRAEGFAGCVAFDCLGAGQRATALAPAGGWRDPGTAPVLFVAFDVLRGLHEALWHLDLAAALVGGDRAGAADVATARSEVARLAAGDLETLAGLDAVAVWRRIGTVLGAVSTDVRREVSKPGDDRQAADLAGVDLRRTRLAGASLRGALLVGADLRDVDLDRTDLLGTDLRGARLHGADLGRALFLTPPQVAAAAGDRRTVLPPHVERPGHWR